MQGGPTYDANGRVTYDTLNTYTWNAYGKVTSVRTGINLAVCGTSGTCVTYDAFGRIAETNTNGTYQQILYGPIGRIGEMSGQTTTSVYLPQPGAGALYAWGTNATNKWFMHPNWVGTKTLSTTLAARSMAFDTAYAPYGEKYASFGNSSTSQDFTGDLQDIVAGLFDTPSREFMANSGRWLSPDPAGASWNAYSYTTNPNSMIDPSGLIAMVPFESNWEQDDAFDGGDGLPPCEITNTSPCIVDNPQKVDQGCPDADCVTVTAPAEGPSLASRLGEAVGSFERKIYDFLNNGCRRGGCMINLSGMFNPFPRPPVVGTKVYRVWGGKSGPYGRSWTRVDPRTVPNYRDAAGLPDTNSGRFLSEGTLTNTDGVTATTASELDGNMGGLDEVVVPNAEVQIDFYTIEVLPEPLVF